MCLTSQIFFFGLGGGDTAVRYVGGKQNKSLGHEKNVFIFYFLGCFGGGGGGTTDRSRWLPTGEKEVIYGRGTEGGAGRNKKERKPEEQLNDKKKQTSPRYIYWLLNSSFCALGEVTKKTLSD